MTDLDELIAEAEEWASSYVSWGDNGLVDRLVDALATVRAERDAALARIAEIEDSLDGTTIVKLAEAEARIAEAAKLHYEHEGPHCHTVCAHRYCRDDAMDQHRWPCPTAVALGLNEGGNENE